MATLAPVQALLHRLVARGIRPPGWQLPLEEGGRGAHQGPALNAPPNHPRGGMHPQGKPLGVRIYVCRFTSNPRRKW